MKLHLLHVKNGLTAIIEHAERKTLIDIHKLEESDRREENLAKAFERFQAAGYVHKATNPIAYWKDHIGEKSAFRVIISHPDEDHIKGFNEFADSIGTSVMWIPTKHIDTINNNEDGKRIKKIVGGKDDGIKFIEPKRKSDEKYYGVGSSDWDQIEILHPAESYQSDSSNQGSYLLKINDGNSTILFGGDTEPETFEWLYDNYPDELKCTVFIASHHGRQSGWPGKNIIEHMNPLMVLIPKGKIEEKDSALGNYTRVLGNERSLTTSYAGNIRLTVDRNDDIDIFECERSFVNNGISEKLDKARVKRNLANH